MEKRDQASLQVQDPMSTNLDKALVDEITQRLGQEFQPEGVGVCLAELDGIAGGGFRFPWGV